jgi:hypothetical protein
MSKEARVRPPRRAAASAAAPAVAHPTRLPQQCARAAAHKPVRAFHCDVWTCRQTSGHAPPRPQYLRSRSVCRQHARVPSTAINGVEQRYCGPCGRFHPLTEFEGDRRSCRASLAKYKAA